MLGALLVRAGGITFRGQPGPNPTNGFTILRDGVTGLHGAGVGVARENKARQGAHGSLSARGWRDGRTITINGIARARSPLELARMADQFAACMADGYDETITADLFDGSTRQYVGGYHASEWQEMPGLRKARFMVQFWCPDPRSYGERRSFTQAAPGLLDVFNRGTFDARPVVSMTATAAMAGYQLRISDGSTTFGNLRMNGIAAGSTVAVDMASGRTTLNGVPTGGLIHSGDRWGVPPGRVLQVMLERDGAVGPGRLTVTHRDTFI